ncbi:MAG: ABC transporter substrate-binding protein [Planctomycetota bacterium]|jgi:iron complex transport system substrate-binding protein
MSQPRVVSLLPSATELVAAVADPDCLVGRSHECDFPPGVESRPSLTRARLSLSMSSAEIDRDVRAVLAGALTVYEVDVEGLRAAAPDVIVTQDLCDVCAVSLDDVQRALNACDMGSVELVNLKPTRLADVLDDLMRVGVALGAEGRAGAVRRELEERLDRCRHLTAAAAERPNVLTIEWIDPVMVGGTWMPELVEIAGGTALVTQPGQHAPTLDLEQLAALDPAPDVVLIKPCGFPLERTRAERAVVDRLLDQLDWPAIATGRVWAADGNAFFNRPGPRLVDSAEILAACVHPELAGEYAERHRGQFEAWRG